MVTLSLTEKQYETMRDALASGITLCTLTIQGVLDEEYGFNEDDAEMTADEAREAFSDLLQTLNERKAK